MNMTSGQFVEVPNGWEIFRFPVPTPRFNKVLQAAYNEANKLQLGGRSCEWVGVEHLLLALLADSEGMFADVMKHFGVDHDVARGEVLRRLKVSGIEYR